MARKIVIASGKGGVGKSTTAAQLGRALAAAGKKTLLVDCDAGLNSLDLLLDADAAVYNWLDVYSGACAFADAVNEVAENLWLVCAPSEKPEDAPEDCIKTVLEDETDAYDFILLDAPAGLGMGLRRAALPADSAIILATADEVSVKGAGKADDTLRGWGVRETRLIVNRYQLKTAKKGRFLTIDGVIDKTYVQLIGVVPDDPALTAYTVTHTLGKRSKSREAYARIARRLQGENVSLTLSQLK